MIQNYIKIAWRNLRRNRTFSFLNIFGLALSMSVCLLILIGIRDAYSYDKFHPRPERIFRILTEAQRKNGGMEMYATSPFPAGQLMKDNLSQTEIWTPLVRMPSGELKSGDKEFNFSGLYTDATFFEMFGFELATGDPARAFEQPYSLVLTDELAARIFPGENPLGKTLAVEGYGPDFRVTGVLKKFAGKTHLEFSALGSLATQIAEEKRPEMQQVSSDWLNYYRTYNFVRLRPGAEKNAVESGIADLAARHLTGLELESRDAGYRYLLQPLDDITPGGMISNSMGNGMPVFLVWFLSVLGSIIMLSACFNYTNLTIARALTRLREMGVRKVMGAGRMQIFGQIMSEAVLASLFALCLGFLMMLLLLPQIERLSITEALDLRIRPDWQMAALFLGFALVVGVLAGLLPALTFARTRPIAVLQKLRNLRLMQRVGLRKFLLTTQFTMTLIFLIIMTIAWQQGKHAITVNFGFDQPQTLLVELQGEPFDRVSAAMGQISGVEQMSGISMPMGTWADASDDVRTDSVPEKTGVRDYFIDQNYLPHFNLKLLAGENFPANPAQQREVFALVNETFVQKFKLGDAHTAVGKQVLLGDSTQLTVRGVLADFPFKPAVYKMEPLLLRYDPAQLQVLNLRFAPGTAAESRQKVRKEWERLCPNTPFRAAFFDETARGVFSEMLDLVRVVGFFGLLGMAIACMGLLGMAIYTVETKAKEISLRKIMGANGFDVTFFLSGQYLWLLGIAAFIAVPVSFWAGSQILQFFSNSIDMSPLLFLPGVLLLLSVAGLAVGSQTWRALRANPVESLRNE